MVNYAKTYVPLWNKSNCSFLEGASHPEELVDQAHALGLPALALTDRNGVYGVVRAHMRAKELAFKLIIGAELAVLPPVHSFTLGTAGSGQQANDNTVTGPAPALSPLVLLCENREGYANLCQLLSKAHQARKHGFAGHNTALVTLPMLYQHAPGLIALTPDPSLLAALHPHYVDQLYALVGRHLCPQDKHQELRLRKQAQQLAVPTLASNEVLYHAATRKPLQDVLTCIRHGVSIHAASAHIRSNAEHDLKSYTVMAERFVDDPGALQRSLEVAERCTFSLDQLRYRYPTETLPNGKDETAWLAELTFQGADQRFPTGVPDQVRQQITRELDLIQHLDYGGYFLTMWEIVQFCKREDIFCQGRGSAANSVVCYCLGITAVDPIKLDLLFERFLSVERAEPPDIDLDIEHQRREEVIQWVYRRYGSRHAAMVCNIIRYRSRSAIRDVGKALGMPQTTLERLAKLLGGRFNDLDAHALRYAGLDPEVPLNTMFLRLVEDIQDFPRHLSIHPGGFLLGHEPIDTLVPIEPAAMPDRVIIQWDKYAVEDLGLFKVDLLALGALSQIHHCFSLIQEHHHEQLSLATLPHDDPATFAMISQGDTVGVFQIESRAQMSMLPRLRPAKFYDLVVEVAIVRPGPIQGDMVHPYLEQRKKNRQPEYPHPALRQVLEKTLGVPIFQEQVMKIAVLVGGYTPGEADQLRRDMAAWKSSGRIERHRDRLLSRMIQNGIAPEFAERIFAQIRGFGEYGFPESHAASFALIAYITAYLRCHYPAAFTCSLLNAQPMGFYSPATLIEDAKRHGTPLRPIDINHSQWDCTLEPTTAATPAHAIRMGLRYIKGFGTREQNAFAAQPGPFQSLEELVFQTRLPVESYEKLARAGALTSLLKGRRDALWQIREVVTRRHDTLTLPPALPPQPLFAELQVEQQVRWDYRESHHSTRGHPLEALRPALTDLRIPTAQALNKLPNGTRTRYVGMTICRQRPGTSTGVTFYTLEDETGFVNLVVWNQVFERHQVLARTALLLGVTGKVQAESDVVHLIADALWTPDFPFAPDGTTTRNFC